MNCEKILISLFLLCSSLTMGIVLAGDANTSDDEVIKKIVADFMQKNDVPGVAVEIYKSGEPHSYYFGYANKDKKIPISKQTIFEIGSISKVMTSLILAQQIDFAKVSLNDSIRKYIQNLPDEYDDVTLQDLATHTSGLPNDLPNHVKSQSDFQNYLSEFKPTFPPEEQWNYSNVGIGMLAYALETVTNKDFAKLYKRSILLPLGMQPIALNVPKKLKGFYAQGYDESGHPAKPVELGLYPASGGLKASSGDMALFLSAAIGLPGTPERILYPMRMTQAVYVKLANEMVGLGWQIHPLFPNFNLLAEAKARELGPIPVKEVSDRPLFNGNALIDKTGTTRGFRSYVAVIPNKKSGIVFLTNKVVSDADIVGISREILFKITDEKAEKHPA